MKTRKIIPLLAVAVVALFALASCDQLLENIYPDQTTPKGNNTVTIDVYTYADNISYYYSGSIYAGPLTIQLYKDGAVYRTQATDLSNPDLYSVLDTTFTFDSLPDGSYTAYAWIDANKNGIEDDSFYNGLAPSYIGYLAGGSSASGWIDLGYYSLAGNVKAPHFGALFFASYRAFLSIKPLDPETRMNHTVNH
jgi:hypothetical protein